MVFGFDFVLIYVYIIYMSKWTERSVHNLYNEIRTFLVCISPSVKLNYYCKILNIDHGNLSKFIHGYNKAVCIDDLLKLRDFIVDDLSEKIS